MSRKINSTKTNKPSSDKTTIYVAIIGLFGTIVIALISVLNTRTEILLPVSLTQTAQVLSPLASPFNTQQAITQPTQFDDEINPVAVKVDRGSGEFTDYEIYLEYADGTKLYLTYNNYVDGDPLFSPDGKLVAFTRKIDTNNDGKIDTDDTYDIYIIDLNGVDIAVNLTNSPSSDEHMFSWSPDGKRIAFYSDRSGGDVYVVDVFSEDITQITFNSGWGGHPAWSPDGEYIAFYSSDDSGSYVTVVRPDGSGLKRLTSTVGNGWGLSWTWGGEIRFPYRGHTYIIRPDGSGFLPADNLTLDIVDQSIFGWRK